MEETLTVPRLTKLQEEWKRNPPMPLLFAAWLGINSERKGTHEELLGQLQAIRTR